MYYLVHAIFCSIAIQVIWVLRLALSALWENIVTVEVDLLLILGGTYDTLGVQYLLLGVVQT